MDVDIQQEQRINSKSAIIISWKVLVLLLNCTLSAYCICNCLA